jgi:hypothetical protein
LSQVKGERERERERGRERERDREREKREGREPEPEPEPETEIDRDCDETERAQRETERGERRPGTQLSPSCLLSGMIARKRGHIINVSSIAGYENYKNGSMYCASKRMERKEKMKRSR